MVANTVYHAQQDTRIPIARKVAGQGDKVATSVYATTNYAQFHLDTRNRPIDENKLVRLYDAVEKRNLLPDNPILVSLDFTVLDGQHRLKVAEALGVPVFYQFASDTTIDDVPTLNNKRSPWKLIDYLSSWCERGNPYYIALRSFMARYEWMNPAVALELCHYGDKAGLRSEFADGRYLCNDIDFAERVARALLDFRASGFQYWNSRVFTYAVSNLMANADYDHRRMLNKLRYNPRGLVPAVSTDDYFTVFTELYNYKERGENRKVLRKLGSNEAKYRADRKAQQKHSA